MTARDVARTASAIVVCVACALGARGLAASQEMPIGIIEFYGLREVSADRARAVLTFKEGDTVSLARDKRPATLTTSERRLTTVPGVARALNARQVTGG